MDMETAAIRLDHVSMRFNVSRERVDCIKEYVIKAFKRRDLTLGGTTVITVSHDNDTIIKFCERAIWLENGCVRDIGPATEIRERYAKQ